jgi:hypothetical protein
MSQQVSARSTGGIYTVLNPLLEILLAKTRTGAILRSILVGLSLAIYWFILVIKAGFPGEIPAEWTENVGGFITFVFNLLIPFFHPQVLIHLIPVLFAILAGIFIGSLYIADLFELDSFQIAFRYLFAAIFGLGYSGLEINQGDLQRLEAGNATNPLVQIGGPGYIKVHLGFSVLTETENGLPRVYGPPSKTQVPKRNFLQGFERLRGLIDLRDQLGKVPEVRAITRDGVEVYARDAQMLFRVYGGGQVRSLETPYPYTESSIRRVIYGQAVENEKEQAWDETLPKIVREEIIEFVGRHTLADFLALQPLRGIETEGTATQEAVERPAIIQIPRRKLTEIFHTDELRMRLHEHGLELAWVGVGTWELRDDQLPPEAAGAGPSKTLTATWRDLQRATIYASPDYQARQRDRRFHDRTAESLLKLISTWKHGEFMGPYRCFGLLSVCAEEFSNMIHVLEGDPEAVLPPETGKVLTHILSMIKPRAIGGEDDFEPLSSR